MEVMVVRGDYNERIEDGEEDRREEIEVERRWGGIETRERLIFKEKQKRWGRGIKMKELVRVRDMLHKQPSV